MIKNDPSVSNNQHFLRERSQQNTKEQNESPLRVKDPSCRTIKKDHHKSGIKSASTSLHRDRNLQHLLSLYMSDSLNDPATASPFERENGVPVGMSQYSLASKKKLDSQYVGQDVSDIADTYYILFENDSSNKERQCSKEDVHLHVRDKRFSEVTPKTSASLITANGAPKLCYLDLRLRQNRLWADEQCQRGREYCFPIASKSPDYEKAEACYKEALSLAPNHYESLVAYGDLHATLGQWDDARQKWTLALKKCQDEKNEEILKRKLESVPALADTICHKRNIRESILLKSVGRNDKLTNGAPSSALCVAEARIQQKITDVATEKALLMTGKSNKLRGETKGLGTSSIGHSTTGVKQGSFFSFGSSVTGNQYKKETYELIPEPEEEEVREELVHKKRKRRDSSNSLSSSNSYRRKVRGRNRDRKHYRHHSSSRNRRRSKSSKRSSSDRHRSSSKRSRNSRSHKNDRKRSPHSSQADQSAPGSAV